MKSIAKRLRLCCAWPMSTPAADTSLNLPAQRPLLGITLMSVGMLLVPLLDACAKILARDYPVLQVAWARFAFHFLWLLPLVIWRGHSWWRPPPMPWFQAGRSLVLLMATVCFFFAIRSNPIPICLALLFVAPLFVSLMAPLLLGEPFAPRRLLAAGAGFVGVLVVLRPGTGGFDPTVLLALVAGFCYALYVVATRRLAGRAPPLLTLFYTAVVGFAVLSLIMPAVWVAPAPRAWAMMGLMGLFAAAGHFLIIKACEVADASLVAPFNYVEIVGATAVGYLVFGFFPDGWAWVGIAIICASGLVVSMLEWRPRRAVPEVVDL